MRRHDENGGAPYLNVHWRHVGIRMKSSSTRTMQSLTLMAMGMNNLKHVIHLVVANPYKKRGISLPKKSPHGIETGMRDMRPAQGHG